KIAADTGLTFEAAPSAPSGPAFALKPMKGGVYHRYHGGTPDEGWTRYIFDTNKIPYSRIDADDIHAGNLNAKFDVIILPSDNVNMLVAGKAGNGGDDEGEAGGRYPPKYEKSLGDSGVAALQ